ncbi:MAG TPA: hypothetical protein VIJ14_02010, partial [Rhabdochlamydiaceae bacterium]
MSCFINSAYSLFNTVVAAGRYLLAPTEAYNAVTNKAFRLFLSNVPATAIANSAWLQGRVFTPYAGTGITGNHNDVDRIEEARLQEQMRELFGMVRPLILDVKSSCIRTLILRSIGELPPVEREDFIQWITPWIQETAGNGDRVLILQAMVKIPHGERENVIKWARPLIQGAPDANARIRTINARTEMIRAIGAIPHGERDRLLEREMPLLLSLANDWERAGMLGVVEKIPPGERDDVFKWGEPLIHDIGFEDKIVVLKAIYDISPAEREDVTKRAKLLIKDNTDAPTRAKILCLVAAIPRYERAQVFTLVRAMDFAEHTSKAELLLYLLLHFATANHAEVMGLLFNDRTKLQLSAAQIIDWVFQTRPHLVAPTHEYLFAKLQNLTAHPRVLRALALNIWTHLAAFRLYDQDLPLAQLALRMRILTEESNDPKNPFNLYAKLKKIAAEAVPVFKTQGQEIEGTAVSLDPAAFQASAKEQKKVTFADLPPGIGPDTLSGHFDALQARLRAMDAPGSAAAEQYIQDANGISFASLRSNFTEDDMVRALVSVQGAASNAVPLSPARFYAIMKFISDQSD